MCGWDRRFAHSEGIFQDRGRGRAGSSEKTARKEEIVAAGLFMTLG